MSRKLKKILWIITGVLFGLVLAVCMFWAFSMRGELRDEPAPRMSALESNLTSFYAGWGMFVILGFVLALILIVVWVVALIISKIVTKRRTQRLMSDINAGKLVNVVTVNLPGNPNDYYYLSSFVGLEKGHKVTVPFGPNRQLCVASVKAARYSAPNATPWPFEQMLWVVGVI